jgi:hypothetical protein
LIADVAMSHCAPVAFVVLDCWTPSAHRPGFPIEIVGFVS